VEDEDVITVGDESVASAFLNGPIKETTDRDIAKRRTGCFKRFSCVRRIGQQAVKSPAYVDVSTD
jgi:hypothetical protein